MKPHAALLLMGFSGFAGLGYQIVWTQQSTSWLGHESAAVLAVVAAFFGGLAAGALAFGSRIAASRWPGRWYAGCELVIAIWSLVLCLAMTPVSTWMLELTGVSPTPARQWAVAFFGTFLLLLPATAAMGATLPAMDRALSKMRSVAALYASNTLGAVIGVLAIALFLIPQWGLTRTAALCVTLNLTCAAAALMLLREVPAAPPPVPDHRATLIRLGLAGFLGIGYEVLVVRVLSQVAEDTVYTFAMLLAVYLLGSAAGAAVYQRRKIPGDHLPVALAVACLAGIASLWAAELVQASVLEGLGASMHAALAAEAILALLAFGLPTFFMGALFSHLCSGGVNLGRALGVNTLGAAVAPLAFGVIAVPVLGPKLALLLIVAGYLALSPRASSVWVPTGATVAIAIWAPRLAFVDVPEGGRVLSYRDGIMASVSVVEDADGVARLHINNHQQEGSSATQRVDSRQAWLPMLLHPDPRSALFLGLGTGTTASAAAEAGTVRVDAVELLREVVAASAQFSLSPRLNVQVGDARRFVRTSTNAYDVIVADNFHPARSGSGGLYTVEHFAAIRGRLSATGIFCQWLPLHQLDLETLRSIVRSFNAVFPRGWALLASNSLETPVVGLVGRRDDGRFETGRLTARLSRETLPVRFGIEDELAVLGSFIAGPEALQHFAGDAPFNTDDRPVVAYRAPRVTYAPDSLPRERLIGLLRSITISPPELLSSADGPLPARLAAYWTARDRFIESGQRVTPSSDVRLMLAQVREPLLAVLRISPDFRPAYDPLVAMASSLAETDASDARALLAELERTQPARPEATRALRAITKLSPDLHGGR